MALKRGEVAWRTAPRKVATAQYLSAPMAPPRMASSAARSSSFCLMRRMVDSRFERVERNVEMESGEKVKNAKTENTHKFHPCVGTRCRCTFHIWVATIVSHSLTLGLPHEIFTRLTMDQKRVHLGSNKRCAIFEWKELRIIYSSWETKKQKHGISVSFSICQLG